MVGMIFLPSPPAPQPQTEKPMKHQTMILLACAIPVLSYATWAPDVLAAVRSHPAAPIAGAPAVDYPLGLRCVVTVDPLAASKPVVAGTFNKVTGFVAPDIAEGVLIRMDDEWLVLRDGCNDDWIPRNKIILIHVCH
jgi:hypothetical protein